MMKNVALALSLTIATGSVACAWVFPNRSLSPGAIAETSTAVVCRPGRAAEVRPVGDEWRALKNAVYQRYGLLDGQHYGVVMDHIVPLELGGASRDVRNLWPEPYNEAFIKDKVEDAAKLMVCVHHFPLADMQMRMARDWTTAIPADPPFTKNEWTWLNRPRGYGDGF